MEFVVAHGGEHVYELLFPLGFKYIGAEPLRVEIVQLQLLRGFAVERLEDIFPVGDVAAHGRVPLQREQVLVGAALLEIDIPFAVDDMQVDDRVQRFGASVAELARGLRPDVARFVHDGQHLLGTGPLAAPQERCRRDGIDQFQQGVSSL